jgi:hypothetical protein
MEFALTKVWFVNFNLDYVRQLIRVAMSNDDFYLWKEGLNSDGQQLNKY